MDDRLERALAFSNYRATVENRRTALKRRFNSMLVVHYNNGMFRATQETISFVAALLANGHQDAIVVDLNENPVQIDNLTEFKDALMNAYFEATNEYSTEMQKLKKARNVKKVMDW